GTDAADDDDAFDEDLLENAKIATLDVGRGDTLQSLFAKVDTEPDEAKIVIEALAAIFQAEDLKSGQEVRFSLVPAPSDTGAMEPIKVSIYAKGGTHIATVQRNRQGDLVATTDGDQLKAQPTVTRAHLYQSF